MEAFAAVPKNATLKVEPYNISIPDEKVAEFKQLLKLSKLGPQTFENADETGRFGVSLKWMSETKKYWEEQYDWRKTEARLNTYNNFTTTIHCNSTSHRIHFIALFSSNPSAIPIVFSHGWPGSFLEFLSLFSLFVDKYKTPDQLPFHVIAPSLPGYTLSDGPPLDRDFGKKDVARVFDQLMVGLGFGVENAKGGYLAQGGDIGSYVSRVLAVDYESCRGVHLNFSVLSRPKDLPDDAEDEIDKQGIQRWNDFLQTGSSYARQHGTRPSTIGFALSSSPLALLAWIGEKFQAWSDVTPPIDEILDSVTLYWLTETFARCIYPYREDSLDFSHEYYIRKPFGYSKFQWELAPMPKAWIETTGDLLYYKRHLEGGHFAAMERPDLLLADVEEFVEILRKKGVF